MNRVVIVEKANTDGVQSLKVNVTTVPEDGKANAAMINLLADYFDLPKSAFTIIRGHTTRSKVVRVVTNDI